jgi:acetyl esterase/lipase
MAHHAHFLVGGLLAAALSAQECRFRDAVFTAVQILPDEVYGWSDSLVDTDNVPEPRILDLYQPAGDTMAARPAFVVVHGGGFVGGSRLHAPIVDLCRRLARHGFVAVSIDYRLSDDGIDTNAADVEAAAHDFQAAVRWLRANAATHRIDVDRIAGIGGSAGAATVLASAYNDYSEGDSGNPGFSSRIRICCDLWGGLESTSTVEADEPPLFICHGSADETVVVGNAYALQQAAVTVGLPYEMHIIQGAGHGPWPQYQQLHFDDTMAFAWHHMDLVAIAGLTGAVASGGSAVTFTGFGTAGNIVALAYGSGPGYAPLPEFGLLLLAPPIVLVGATLLPTTERLTSTTVSLAVPPLPAGTSIPWQTMQIGATSRLSNAVTTTF